MDAGPLRPKIHSLGMLGEIPETTMKPEIRGGKPIEVLSLKNAKGEIMRIRFSALYAHPYKVKLGLEALVRECAPSKEPEKFVFKYDPITCELVNKVDEARWRALRAASDALISDSGYIEFYMPYPEFERFAKHVADQSPELLTLQQTPVDGKQVWLNVLIREESKDNVLFKAELHAGEDWRRDVCFLMPRAEFNRFADFFARYALKFSTEGFLNKFYVRQPDGSWADSRSVP